MYAPAWELERENISFREIADAVFDARKSYRSKKNQNRKVEKIFEDEVSKKEKFRQNVMSKALRPALTTLGVNINVYSPDGKRGYQFPALTAYFCWFLLTSNTQRENYFSQLKHNQSISSSDEVDFFLSFTKFIKEKFENVPISPSALKEEVLAIVFHQ